MKSFRQFVIDTPEIQDLSQDEQQFFYDSYVEDYRFSMDILSEDPDPYGDCD